MESDSWLLFLFRLVKIFSKELFWWLHISVNTCEPLNCTQRVKFRVCESYHTLGVLQYTQSFSKIWGNISKISWKFHYNSIILEKIFNINIFQQNTWNEINDGGNYQDHLSISKKKCEFFRNCLGAPFLLCEHIHCTF